MSTAQDAIVVTVMDEKGSKASCKLYKNDTMKDILKKYNAHLQATYDSILHNDLAVDLNKTPHQLGITDGNFLRFSHITTPTTTAASTAPANPPQQTAPTLSAAETQKVLYLTKQLEQSKRTIVDLEAKLQAEHEKNQCQICFDSTRDTVILPCLHADYCSKCMQGVTTKSTPCPTCRGHIMGVLLLKRKLKE
eukprot:TRINITY_DN3279_c0_g1_i1.p1 TRINITY_DN3279_c0_g1~~TRINITY_DN3279_c0_g1_i1.p1  ORF type:complete len:213 (+),score=53.21 TRINITY_DN3279_c0_g1_i1:63-641(+)